MLAVGRKKGSLPPNMWAGCLQSRLKLPAPCSPAAEKSEARGAAPGRSTLLLGVAPLLPLGALSVCRSSCPNPLAVEGQSGFRGGGGAATAAVSKLKPAQRLSGEGKRICQVLSAQLRAAGGGQGLCSASPAVCCASRLCFV